MVVLRMPLAGPSPVFGLALLLAVLLLGLAQMLANGVLPFVALVCVALLELVWLHHGAVPANAAATLASNVGFYAMFAQSFRSFSAEFSPDGSFPGSPPRWPRPPISTWSTNSSAGPGPTAIWARSRPSLPFRRSRAWPARSARFPPILRGASTCSPGLAAWPCCSSR